MASVLSTFPTYQGHFGLSDAYFTRGNLMAEKKAAKPVSKSAMFQSLAEATGLSRKQVAAVFDEITNLIRRDVGKKGPGVFALPGLLKIKRVNRPAKPARE